MIFRMELSSIRSSPALATGTMACAGAGLAGAGTLDLMDAARAAAADASDDGGVDSLGEELAAA